MKHRRLFALAPVLASVACAAAACGTSTGTPRTAQSSTGPRGAFATQPAHATPAVVAKAATQSPDPTPPSASASSSASASASTEEAPDAAPVSGHSSACNEQPPQEFLIRKNFFPKWNAPADEAKERAAAHQRAIQYRTEQYGYFPGFGSPSMNPHPPSFYTQKIEWMGLPVVVHKKIVPALQCVEEEIKLACADHPYTAHALGGIRFQNTYHTGEITNHAYGIAMDIDPAINSCCGCVPPWNSNPLCHKHAATEYDRMAMPECWVHAFEKYGFYWLGHDVLQDTMHFEFLGDPDKILKNPPPPDADGGVASR